MSNEQEAALERIVAGEQLQAGDVRTAIAQLVERIITLERIAAAGGTKPKGKTKP